jgi:hypothetical protein
MMNKSGLGSYDLLASSRQGHVIFYERGEWE